MLPLLALALSAAHPAQQKIAVMDVVIQAGAPAGAGQILSEAIVAEVRARLPDAIVLLNAILPRGAPGDPLRAEALDVNARIAALADGDHVRFIDAGPRFLDAEGRIAPELMPDSLHLGAAGYEVWATALRPAIADALSNERRSTPSSGRSR